MKPPRKSWSYWKRRLTKPVMKTHVILLLMGLLVSGSLAFTQPNPSTDPPNIVLILVDDAGLMDFGAFGGEAKTPNIDRLAQQGMMFTNLHASPTCAPSRAMLMTGSDSHLAGVANLPEMLPKSYQGLKGYAGVLNDSVQTIATRLKELEYRTYVAGKWHLGHDEHTLPSKRGFDRSFILAGSGADNYEQVGYLPFKAEVQWFADGEPASLPDDFYSSAYYVDQLIRFHEEETDPSRPFFSYLPFQAVHAPLQAPKELVKPYEAVYQAGWDAIREARFRKAKEMGILPEEAAMNPVFDELQKWENLSAETQQEYALNMAMMAGMLEAMDHHIGRYLTYLEEQGLADNTLFIITSDNGPDGASYGRVAKGRWAKKMGYHRDFDTYGGKRYYGGIGPESACALAGPFSFFKYYTGEGGLRVPLLMAGPGIPEGAVSSSFCFITDIAPTIYEAVGISTQATEGYVPIAGKSMLPHILDPNTPIYEAEEGVGLEAGASSAYFLGNHKIVKNNIPLGDGQWRMYNLALDPGETRDISAEQPLQFQVMLSAYQAYAEEVGVQEMPAGYAPVKEVNKKSAKAILNPFK
jgi:arylsulfatase A-like enzyme